MRPLPPPDPTTQKVSKGCTYVILACAAVVVIALTVWLILALFT